MPDKMPEGSGSITTREEELTTPARPSRLVAVAGFGVLGLTIMINATDRQVFLPLLPAIRSEYGLSLPAGGLLATVFTLGMALAGLPAGYIVDRFSRKTVLLASIVVYSLGTLATPLAAGLADMAAYRIVSGFGEGMQAAALFAVAGGYFFRRRTLALGGIATAFGLGSFLGPNLGVQFAQAYQSWRAPFFLLGACGFVVVVIAGFVVSSRITERAVDLVDRVASYEHVPASPYNRNSIALAASALVGGLVFYGFLGLYPTYLISELHYSAGEAALATSFAGFGTMLSIGAGWLSDRVNQRTVLIVSYLALAATSVAVYQTHLAVGWQCVLAFLMGALGLGFIWSNTNSALQRSVRPEKVGRASGLFITTYYTAAAVSGLLFAALVDWLGWSQAGLWQITLLSVVGVVAVAFVRTPQLITGIVRRDSDHAHSNL